MATVEYKGKMTDGIAKNGSCFIECVTGSLNVGDVVVKKHTQDASRGGFRRPRGPIKTTVETFVVTGFGGEFYSDILKCDAVRAYCEKTVEFLDDN
jgi:hypothetical protein